MLILLLIASATLYLYSNLTFSVSETEWAIVVQFGEVREVVDQPGRYNKNNPFEQIVYLDKGIICSDLQAVPIVTQDQIRLEFDTYLRWEILDPLEFYDRFGKLRGRADFIWNDVIYSEIRSLASNTNAADLESDQFLSNIEIRSQVAVGDMPILLHELHIEEPALGACPFSD